MIKYLQNKRLLQVICFVFAAISSFGHANTITCIQVLVKEHLTTDPSHCESFYQITEQIQARLLVLAIFVICH